VRGGVLRADLRIYDGDRYHGYGLLLSGRFPALDGLRLTPRLYSYYRQNQALQDFVQIRPSMRLEYRLKPWLYDTRWIFDADLGYEWMQSLGSGLPSALSSQSGYFFNVGLRLDF